MGQTGSRVVGKLANSFSFNGTPENNNLDGTTISIPKFRGGTPLVYTRRGYEQAIYFQDLHRYLPCKNGLWEMMAFLHGSLLQFHVF